MFEKRLPGRSLAFKSGDGSGLLGRNFGSHIGGVGLEIFELQLHLVEQPAGALGAGTLLFALQLGDLQLEVQDHGLSSALQSR